jgi:hypothetical protein
MSDRAEAARSDLFRQRLRSLVDAGGGNRAFASAADIPLKTLNNYLAGVSREPPFWMVVALAGAGGVTPLWLGGFDDGSDAGTGLREELVPWTGPVDEWPEKAGHNRGRWVIRSRALDLMGFVPGDIAEFDLANLKPRLGQIVVAQVYQPDGTAETVHRIFRPPYLMTWSTDPGVDLRPVEIREGSVAIMGTFVRLLRNG